jgi:hypothetical protein
MREEDLMMARSIVNSQNVDTPSPLVSRFKTVEDRKKLFR